MHKTNNIAYAPHKTALHMLVHRSIALHYEYFRILAQILIFDPHKLGLMEILGFAHSVYPRPILHMWLTRIEMKSFIEEINIYIELLLCFEMPTNSSS